jgi:hypothetical protein
MGATAGNTDDKEMSKAIIKEPAILEISKKVEQFVICKILNISRS